MPDFDWAWPKRIDREAVESAVALDFIEKAHNVVLVAPQGLGKTMIAQNIANVAVLAGHSVLFTTAAQLLLDLGA
jgi:DNA replication protein DnaC